MMFDISYVIAPIIGAFSGIIGTYVIGKRMLSDDKILEKVDLLLDEMTTNEDMLRKIYTIAGVAGKGLRDGVGIDKLIPKRKGGLEGILLDLVGNFLGQRFGVAQDGQEVIPPNQQQRKQLTETWR
jgi:hypothetical protein